MKKFIVMLLSAILCFGLAACGEKRYHAYKKKVKLIHYTLIRTISKEEHTNLQHRYFPLKKIPVHITFRPSRI